MARGVAYLFNQGCFIYLCFFLRCFEIEMKMWWCDGYAPKKCLRVDKKFWKFVFVEPNVLENICLMLGSSKSTIFNKTRSVYHTQKKTHIYLHQEMSKKLWSSIVTYSKRSKVGFLGRWTTQLEFQFQKIVAQVLRTRTDKPQISHIFFRLRCTSRRFKHGEVSH